MNSQYAIETFSLTKVFPDWWGRAKVIAVDNLDLKIKKNEVYGLLGPNGSGKTTTIKMLLSLLYPTKGKAIVLGGQSSDTAVSSKIGYLPEESYLYKYLSARETLDFYGRLFGLPSQVRKTRIDALLDMVGLSAVARRPVGTFSKGMARRIGLAQALINDPELLILDEPTSGLDPLGTRQIKDLIIKLAERGKTILLCSHLLADVEDVCDRIAILYGGKIQCQGHVSELLVQTGKKQITTENLSDDAMQRIRQIIESECSSYDITVPMEKLESFFIDIVNKAQSDKLKTSGAISTTALVDFLAENGHAVLENLVEGTGRNQTQTETETVKQTSSETAEDKSLLENLTKSAQVEKVEMRPGKALEPVASSPQEQIDKQLLDSLTKDESDSTEKDGPKKDA
jgi:ABC-2 type transport system ATP-binding protein